MADRWREIAKAERKLEEKAEKGLLPLKTEDLRRQLQTAFRSEKESSNPVILALRADQPVIIGRKCDPFCPSESSYRATKRCIRLLNDFGLSSISCPQFMIVL